VSRILQRETSRTLKIQGKKTIEPEKFVM